MRIDKTNPQPHYTHISTQILYISCHNGVYFVSRCSWCGLSWYCTKKMKIAAVPKTNLKRKKSRQNIWAILKMRSRKSPDRRSWIGPSRTIYQTDIQAQYKSHWTSSLFISWAIWLCRERSILFITKKKQLTF